MHRLATSNKVMEEEINLVLSDEEWEELWDEVKNYAHLQSLKHSVLYRAEYIETAQLNILQQLTHLKHNKTPKQKKKVIQYSLNAILYTHCIIARKRIKDGKTKYYPQLRDNKTTEQVHSVEIEEELVKLSKPLQKIAKKIMDGHTIRQLFSVSNDKKLLSKQLKTLRESFAHLS